MHRPAAWMATGGLAMLAAALVNSGCQPDRSPPATGQTAPAAAEFGQRPVDSASGVLVVRPFRDRQTPRIPSDASDIHGQVVTISCASCHSNLPINRQIRAGDDLQEFHRGLVHVHGPAGDALSCLTCHHEENYNHLRLVDGRPVEFSESRRLCAQCHGKQNSDYEHGAHGGMLGYWDPASGPQIRKTCIDCHDPHAPSFPAMMPTFKARDRFKPSASDQDDHAGRHPEDEPTGHLRRLEIGDE